VGTPARAADEPEGRAAAALRPGAWALQFSILDNFRLGSFDGSVISIKRHTSARSAWRLGLSTSVSDSDREFVDDYAVPDTTLVRTEDTSSLSFGLGLARVWYPSSGQTVRPYYGAGPYVHFLSTENEVEELGEVRSMETDRSTLGAQFLLGAEWFPARSVGVHAEYGAHFAFTKETREDVPPPSTTFPRERTETSGWDFRGDGVRFGASWYF
jgi:hypothetical protein